MLSGLMTGRGKLCGNFGHESLVMALRVLVDCDGCEEFLGSDGVADRRLGEAIGLVDEDMGDAYDRAAVHRKLGKLKRLAVRRLAGAEPALASRNMRALADSLGLDRVEAKLLVIAVAAHGDRLVHNALQTLGNLNNTMLVRHLAVLAEATEREVAIALSRSSRLWRCGLVRLDGSNYSFEMKLDLPPGLLFSFDQPVTDPIELLGGALRKVKPGELTLDDYSHLSFVRDYLVPVLAQQGESRPGTRNILLWGPPGCGKTTLSRALAEHCGLDLYEVACESDGGDLYDGDMRLRIAQLAQHMFRNNPRAAILLDESEDVFGQAGPWGNAVGAARKHKGYLHKLLDEALAPTFWLTNSVEHVDPATTRRFVVFELPNPSKAQRLQMFRRIAGTELVDEAILDALAAQSEVAPGVVAGVASVVGAVREWDVEQRGKAMRCFVYNTLKAQNGGREVRAVEVEQTDACYDLGHVNTDGPVQAIHDRIARVGTGRVLLTGYPGCGKTAFARHVAKTAGMQLRVARVSDILGPFVGESELKLAELFNFASRNKAILMIDEIDSMLFQRSAREQAYVTRLTNEMLTQLEQFQGVFFGSTNMVADLVDPAALRRFDFKINFDWLKPGQSQSLLAAHCQNLGLPAPSPANLAAVAALNCLAPGDFAAVVRQAPIAPIVDASDLVSRLANEVRYKPESQGRRGFGFLAELAH